MRALKVLCFFVLLTACATPPPPPAPPPAEIWPTAGWTISTPEEQGIDSDVLADAIEALHARHVHSLFLERNGHAIVDAYFFPFRDNETHDLASVTKSVVSTLIGIAQRNGDIDTLDRPIESFLPGQTFVDPRERQITLSQILDMTSGLDCSSQPGVDLLREMEHSSDWVQFALNLPEHAQPGTRFQYCGEVFHLASAALTRAAGESAFSLAARELFAPLGIRNAVWPSDPQGNSRGFAELELEPRDAAKLGYLWLHKGRWDGQEIIPSRYLAVALAAHANVQRGIQYGYGMWLYPGHVPYDFEANGRGGQRITVVPDENLVSVVTSGGANANIVAPLIAAAVKSNFPLPANQAGDARLARAVAQAALAPVGFATPPVPLWAREIAGIRFLVNDNPFGLRALSFALGAPGEISVRMAFADGTSAEHAIGFDGVPRLSVDPATGHRVALRGDWRRDGLDLDYDEIALIDDFHLRIERAGNGLSIHLLQRTGPIDMMLTGVSG